MITVNLPITEWNELLLLTATEIPAAIGTSLIGLISTMILVEKVPGKGTSGFDRLSKVYDLLVLLVFGRALQRAQTSFINKIKPGARVLVVGGGTGLFLEALLRKAQSVQITYVELSKRMLEKSRNRIERSMPEMLNRVTWVHGTVHDLPETTYDLICTHCFLDLFEGEELIQEIAALRMQMHPAGAWYFSDFNYVSGWPMSWISQSMIWGMYRFFRWTCGIRAGQLSDFPRLLKSVGLVMKDRRTYYGGMLESVWYEFLPHVDCFPVDELHDPIFP